jgi:hypothetical protein
MARSTPDELLDVLDLGRRAIREAVGERRGLHLQLDEPLQRPVTQLLGERGNGRSRARDVDNGGSACHSGFGTVSGRACSLPRRGV